MTQDLVIKYEEIVFGHNGIGSGVGSGEVNKTIVHHDNTVHTGHRESLKKLHDKHHNVK